jgi:phosphoribosylamine--glycine ligase
MKILIIGQGGREHALARAFRLSSSVTEVHVAPGNDGMTKDAQCHPLNWQKPAEIVTFCRSKKIDFVFIGPDDPVVAGLADQLRAEDLRVVGPSKEGARLEGSKIFAK